MGSWGPMGALGGVGGVCARYVGFFEREAVVRSGKLIFGIEQDRISYTRI